MMRIASLLPSATEVCFALGLGPQLVGVSHECDFPSEAAELPALTKAAIQADRSSASIHAQVKDRLSRGLSLYPIDIDAMRKAAPDLIITQDLCSICAVSSEEVRKAAQEIAGREVEVMALSPLSYADTLADIVHIGERTQHRDRALHYAESLQRRFQALREKTRPWTKKRVLMLEWLEPPMVAGHWTPELIEAAGGEAVLGHRHSPTRKTNWEALAASDPDLIVLAPCGFKVEQTQSELAMLRSQKVFRGMEAVREGHLWIVDGNAYFNRPGPRLVEGAEIVATLLHPDASPNLRAAPKDSNDARAFRVPSETW